MSLELDKYIDALFPPQRDMKSKFWHDNTIWAVIQTYPADLRIKCERLRHLFSQFVYEGDFSALTPDEEFNYQFFQKFYYWLSKTEQFETSFTRAGGLKLEIGRAHV